jgi:hypothetical protein
VWNEDSKVVSVLPNQADDTPWDSPRPAVAVDEEIHPILGPFPAQFEVLIYESESVVSDLNFVTRTG